MTLVPGTRLGPYEIVSALGAGGMGEVYRARDRKLDRDVAIKVLPESVASDARALSRFEREAKAVAALSHPNILAIHDFGTDNGVSYAVTELLEGQTLRGKLLAGPIPQKQALAYAQQLASGIAAAHERGVVHRDLKPENTFITRDSHLKILDFGLAKRVEPVSPEETDMATVTDPTAPGTVLGTVGYMSPEQVRALPVDHRSDIFSFGAILYEMLSGKRAFKRNTAADTMSAILKEEPEPLSGRETGISPALDVLVRHCLEKEPENRFQSARDLVFALSESAASPRPPAITGVRHAPVAGRRRYLVGAIAVVVGIAAALLLYRSRSETREATAVTRIAVLPFENLGTPGDDYFADGMGDEIRGKLTTIPGLEVIARDSSIAYKKSSKSFQEISRELAATHLLRATVRWEKRDGTSRVLVTPELVAIRQSGPTSVWQQSFVAPLTDVFQVQADVATRVAQALGVVLSEGEERRLAAALTKNLEAYELFLKGEKVWRNWGEPNIGTGLEVLRSTLALYERAVSLDPDFAEAWARVADLSLHFQRALPIHEKVGSGYPEAARKAAEKAVALAPKKPDGYLALGLYLAMSAGDHAGALDHFAKARELAPGSSDALTMLGSAEFSLDRIPEAIDHLRQAERLDPRSIDAKATLAWMLLVNRRAREARDVADRGLAFAPTNVHFIAYKAMSYLAEGDLESARRVFEAAPKESATSLVASAAGLRDLTWALDQGLSDLLVRLTAEPFGDKGVWAMTLVETYALSGDRENVRRYAEEARKSFEEDCRAMPQSAEAYALLGLSLAYLGKREEAIREGERAVQLKPSFDVPGHRSYNQHQLVRIYALVGEHEKAMDKLEVLMTVPYVLTPAWLRIDPNFDPLRSHPRFQKLIAGKT